MLYISFPTVRAASNVDMVIAGSLFRKCRKSVTGLSSTVILLQRAYFAGKNMRHVHQVLQRIGHAELWRGRTLLVSTGATCGGRLLR